MQEPAGVPRRTEDRHSRKPLHRVLCAVDSRAGPSSSPGPGTTGSCCGKPGRSPLRASSPWQKCGVAPRAPRRPPGKARCRMTGQGRGARISGIFERRAEPSARGARGGAPRTKTPSGGMHRRSNAGGLLPRAARWAPAVVCAVLASMGAGDPQRTPEAPVSGQAYQTLETRALQSDEFANPGLLWVDRGQTPPGTAVAAIAMGQHQRCRAWPPDTPPTTRYREG